MTETSKRPRSVSGTRAPDGSRALPVCRSDRSAARPCPTVPASDRHAPSGPWQHLSRWRWRRGRGAPTRGASLLRRSRRRAAWQGTGSTSTTPASAAEAGRASAHGLARDAVVALDGQLQAQRQRQQPTRKPADQQRSMSCRGRARQSSPMPPTSSRPTGRPRPASACRSRPRLRLRACCGQASPRGAHACARRAPPGGPSRRARRARAGSRQRPRSATSPTPSCRFRRRDGRRARRLRQPGRQVGERELGEAAQVVGPREPLQPQLAAVRVGPRLQAPRDAPARRRRARREALGRRARLDGGQVEGHRRPLDAPRGAAADSAWPRTPRRSACSSG